MNELIVDASLTWCRGAAAERIASESLGAGADWQVIENRALCRYTAGSGTGIDASLPYTGSVAGTVRVHGTLWSAVWWAAEVIS